MFGASCSRLREGRNSAIQSTKPPRHTVGSSGHLTSSTDHPRNTTEFTTSEELRSVRLPDHRPLWTPSHGSIGLRSSRIQPEMMMSHDLHSQPLLNLLLPNPRTSPPMTSWCGKPRIAGRRHALLRSGHGPCPGPTPSSNQTSPLTLVGPAARAAPCA